MQIEARQVQENPGEAADQAGDVPGSTPVPPPISWMHVGPYLGLLAVLWSWAVWIDAGFWSTNDNYSYGWIVPPLMLFFLWRRVQSQPEAFWTGLGTESTWIPRLPGWSYALAALLVFPLEVLRTEYHQSGIVLWAIHLAALLAALGGCHCLGGPRLVGLVAFPILFFLTAVPWPAKLELPLVQGMMKVVAAVVSEALLWLAVPVRTDGAVLHLSSGPVGIVEACSGIRSLQSGLMVCLAVGELVGLSRARRWMLVGLTIGLALVSNFARTFALCWIMEFKGEAQMHARHDMIGNIAMYSLYGLIFVAAQILARKHAEDIWPEPGRALETGKFRWLAWQRLPDLRGLLAGIAAMLVLVHGWYAVLRWKTTPQLAPQFALRTNGVPGLEIAKFEEYVWAKLGADMGDTVRLKMPEAPLGMVSAYHLFWKPSVRSRTALHHRPDSCMPGSGWRPVGEPQRLEFEMGGRKFSCMAFQFERSDLRAVQLWGVWRNGESVQMDYSSKLTALPEVYGWLPSNRHMKGIELVSCFVPYRDGAPPVSVAVKALERLFEFKPF